MLALLSAACFGVSLAMDIGVLPAVFAALTLTSTVEAISLQ
jgi:hypothetical protein